MLWQRRIETKAAANPPSRQDSTVRGTHPSRFCHRSPHPPGSKRFLLQATVALGTGGARSHTREYLSMYVQQGPNK